MLPMQTLRNRKLMIQSGSRKTPSGHAAQIVRQSRLFKEFAAEREEILRHKWLLSERAGRDVGFNVAAYDWIANHRADWRLAHRSVSAKARP